MNIPRPPIDAGDPERAPAAVRDALQRMLLERQRAFVESRSAAPRS